MPKSKTSSELSASQVQAMTVSELRDELAKRKLSRNGLKPVLKDRLLDSLKASSAEPLVPVSVPDSPEREREPLLPTNTDSNSSSARLGTSNVCDDAVRDLVRAEVQSAVSAAVTESIVPLLNSSARGTAAPEGGPQAPMPPPPPAVSANLPPVSKTVQEKILRGEFVELSSLLPEVAASAHDSDGPSYRLTTNPSGSGSLNIVPVEEAKTVRRKVTDLTTWIEAWTTYTSILCWRTNALSSRRTGSSCLTHGSSTTDSFARWSLRTRSNRST